MKLRNIILIGTLLSFISTTGAFAGSTICEVIKAEKKILDEQTKELELNKAELAEILEKAETAQKGYDISTKATGPVAISAPALALIVFGTSFALKKASLTKISSQDLIRQAEMLGFSVVVLETALGVSYAIHSGGMALVRKKVSNAYEAVNESIGLVNAQREKVNAFLKESNCSSEDLGNEKVAQDTHKQTYTPSLESVGIGSSAHYTNCAK